MMNKKHIWIYGAGFIGTFVAERLVKRGVKIEGFVTSSGENGFISNHNLEVKCIEDIDTPNNESLFIIALDIKHKKEIDEKLIKKGYTNTLFWEDIDISEYWKSHSYHFIDRKKGSDKVCFVLGGYKDFIWEDVFDRLIRFVPEDVEVCVLSSGKYVDELSKIAEENDWSYLYTDYNSVTYIQNIAVSLYPEAEYIYKMDEDMFLTEECFERLLSAYKKVEKNEPYNVGFVAPLIPINGYGHIRILDRLKKREEYENRFDSVLFGCQPQQMLESSIEAAEYMWGFGEDIPYLDELNKRFMKSDIEYSYCNVRFSIGFIMFRRKLWVDMWGFSVSGNPDMGVDEEEICMFCMKDSYALVVAEDSVVGHFSFGPQTMMMKDFYLSHREVFKIR